MTANLQHIVRSLTCKRDLEMALRAYRSFIHYNQQDSKLVIHTDGTLNQGDIERLYLALPGIEVIDRMEKDEEVKEALWKYPNCLKFRESHPLSNKILDIPVLEPTCVKFIDCDILFLKPFDGFFSGDGNARFCLEDDCGYSGRLLELKKISSNLIPEGCNTGIFQLDKQKIDFDYIEWFLSQKHLCTYLGMVEQTLYAIFMGRTDARMYGLDQINTSKKRLSITEKTVAVHFMYDLKNKFFEFADRYESNEEKVVATIKLHKARKLNYSYILKRALNSRLRKVKSASLYNCFFEA
jgi:hypothetical protein